MTNETTNLSKRQIDTKIMIAQIIEINERFYKRYGTALKAVRFKFNKPLMKKGELETVGYTAEYSFKD